MSVKTSKLILALRDEYREMYNSLQVNAEKNNEVNGILNKIITNRSRYEHVATLLNIPWYFIAVVHQMEASGSFNTHLHNGDPLTERTVQVPRGYPKIGTPPFTWEESALDAMIYEGYKDVTCWSLTAILYRFEKYNGFGYRNRTTINSPYLWSYSQHYEKGKFVGDGVFDPNPVSKQPGAAVLLKQLIQKLSPEIKLEDEPEITMPELWQVKCDPAVVNITAAKLQLLLNKFGFRLNPDGQAGQMTSSAVSDFTGKFLAGDSRAV